MSTTRLDDRTRAFLEEKRFAVLATINRDGMPQLSTMWYELQGDQIMMNTADGRVKAANMRRDPRVALCIEDEYSYVTLYGSVELNDDQQIAQADIHRLAVRYHHPAKAEQMMRDRFSKQQRITLRMTIDRVVAEW